MKLRLAHRIREQARGGSLQGMLKYTKEGCADTFLDNFTDPTCVHIIADNVKEYIDTMVESKCQGDKEFWTIDSRRYFAQIAPPFENCFIECQAPNDVFPQIGYSCVSFHKDKDDTLTNCDWEWLITISVIVTLPNGRVGLTGDKCIVKVSKEGSLVGWKVFPGGLCHEVTDEFNADQDKAADACWIGSVFQVPLMTLNFMNCRNVELMDITDEAGPPPKWLRRRRQPRLVYRTVTIDPMKPRRGRRNNDHSIPGQCSRHICRGHFRTYTPETSKGLFGRYFGTYWVPAHERGDPTNGEIITTYNVKAGIPT